MAEREPWERQNNPEPWERPDKPAPWLHKQKDTDPWDHPEDSTARSAQPQSQAVNDLRNAENSAVSGREPSYYTGHGKDSQENTNPGFFRNRKGSAKGQKSHRGRGALITIIIIIACGGTFLGVSNSLLAPALSALITANTQTSFTSYSLRTKHIMKGMMDGTGAGSVTTGWTGKVKYSRIPNYMKTRLAKYNIEVEGSGSNTILKWNGEDIDANRFITMYNDNAEFREAYTRAKRGRVATFFDNIANKLYQKLGLPRNIFSNYKQTNDLDTDVGNYQSTMEPKFEGSTTNLHTNASGESEPRQVYDADGRPVIDPNTGEPVTVRDPVDLSSNGSSTTGSAADIDTAKASARTMIQNIAGSVGKVGSGICTALKIFSMITTAAAAQEMYNSITYFMTQMESISKMKAGYGDASAINPLLNFLTTSEETNVEDYNGFAINLPWTTASDDVPATGEDDIPQKTEKGAPVEASGLQKVLADAPTTKESTANYSLERTIKAVGGAALFGAGTATTCAGIDLFNSVVSLAVTLSPAGIVKIAGSFLSDFIFNLVISNLVAGFLNFLVPTLAKVFFTNVFDTATGIVAGQFLMMGANAANSREGRSGSGQSPSDADSAKEFNKSTQTVLAMEAEQDRLTHSPFDTSNPNTFFGSIAYSLLPTITSTNITGLTSFIRSASTSLATLFGRVSAEGEGTTYQTTFGDCPLLDEIGAVGDLYCNPIISADTSTEMIELSPDDSYYNEVLTNPRFSVSAKAPAGVENLKCDDEGNCEVQDNSNLARYITYCDGRDSPFGVVDQNIVGKEGITDSSILSSVPILGDIISALDAANISQVIPWANGERCGNTAQNREFWESQGKYYQRYIEDQRILEQMGAYEGSKNPVTAYEEKVEAEYLKEHPEANTYVGYLSRISGLTLENAETVLAYVTYYNYIDNYDPSLRIAMTGDTTEYKTGEEVIAEFHQSHPRLSTPEYVHNPIEDKVIANKYVVYYNIRNRSYAA